MKKSLVLSLLLGCSLSFGYAQQADKGISSTDNINRIINTLASDEMRGRSALNLEDIGRAADFIAQEFKNIGLKPYAEDNFRQTFQVNQSKTRLQEITWNKKKLADDQFLIMGNVQNLQWDQHSKISKLQIAAGDDFSQKFREFMQQNPDDAIVLVDKKHAAFLARFKKIYSRDQITTSEQGLPSGPSKVFVVADSFAPSYSIRLQKETSSLPMFNVAGIIPGKSKADEYVIFSSHYDHIGILPAVGQDSIANGADDDASGTTAMIELARYYQGLQSNERTLIFVSFTAEEIGMFGSKYFSNNIDPEKVTAMINIEMIGKDSKFGPNSLYITGYDASNLGKLMQENLAGSAFTFHADPYKTQNLFYRSDNAVLAALGVPAHTFSTSQIDKDSYYHTVKDEVSTLDIQNIKSSIEAIARGAIGLINGTQTPTRVEKLRD